jgi:hypothetical protein
VCLVRDRTGDPLVADAEENLIRRGAATTYVFSSGLQRGNLGNYTEPGGIPLLLYLTGKLVESEKLADAAPIRL